MKKQYNTPTLDLELLLNKDIITASDDSDNTQDDRENVYQDFHSIFNLTS